MSFRSQETIGVPMTSATTASPREQRTAIAKGSGRTRPATSSTSTCNSRSANNPSRTSWYKKSQQLPGKPRYPACATGRPTNHIDARASTAGEIGCSLMGSLPALHVNTTLLILISALYADARLCRASPAHTRRQARERALRCASSSIRGGGFERSLACRHLHRHRTTPKPAN